MQAIYHKEKQEIRLRRGERGLDIARRYFGEHAEHILCMSCDCELQSLNNVIPPGTRFISFYDIYDPHGAQCLAVSTTALMLMAAEGLFPDTRISVEHSYGAGFFCEATNPASLPEDYLERLETTMREHIEAGFEFEERLVSHTQIREFDYKRFRVLHNSSKKYIRIYDLCGFPHWFIAPLTPSAAAIRQFRITPYESGFVLEFPNNHYPDSIPPFTPGPNLFKVFRESEKRGTMLQIRNVSDLNERALQGRHMEAVHLYEALHEKKIAQIADTISKNPEYRFIFIAGPSSSGKTTFMKRLSLQLRINGLKPLHLSLDDYFVEREDTPRDEHGEYDFEHFHAIDHSLLDKQLSALIRGEAVHLPRFMFNEGKKVFDKDPTVLHKDAVMIIEGIHGLNPELAASIPDNKKCRIYISALTQLNFNLYNRVSTSDTRLLRRMYRDLQFRGHSLENTLLRWPSVRRGEARWIFPFQENADLYFNSALEYEWSVFRGVLADKLSAIPLESPVKVEAERLYRLLELFVPFEANLIPSTSIIKEFLGGSSFKY
ncbi:MAG: nucleoside kinase [Candidatus Marinimicrobia bacterium]|jgi:uridine kinase|nr:nucleoside kinase [Candidatus Neomarinimicrobiota bacterium]MDD4961430.1 nucleoside kinase [Candidatus Neomarinimicrobiota bacterium]MDD5709392.1 nucleoside kinase [Candidatus Neomarinimicrobiota bacterium]MDX9777238.1 nucleoside kinase [bacterium]